MSVSLLDNSLPQWYNLPINSLNTKALPSHKVRFVSNTLELAITTN